MKVPLRSTDYDSILRVALTRAVGLSAEDAERLISARWPLIGPRAVLDELYGRGWEVSEVDLQSFLEDVLGEDWDGDLSTLVWSPQLVDLFLDWSEATGHGRLTPMGEIMRAQPAVPIAFAQLAKAHAN